MNKLKVLVACEESQAVTIELRRLGHEAYSCDIEPCSGNYPEWHIQQDVIPLLNGNCSFKTMDGAEHYIDGQWDMLICFPPCTDLSSSGAAWFEQNGKFLDTKGMSAENNILKKIDINVIAHFGNAVSLELMCENICPYSCYNNTKNIGILIRALIEFFDLSEEDGLRVSMIRNIPIRVVFDGTNTTHWGEKAIGIGHYMKDKYILFSEFSKLDEI